MLKRYLLNLLMGLALLATLLGALVLGSGASTAHTYQTVSVPSIDHFMADVADPPPGH